MKTLLNIFLILITPVVLYAQKGTIKIRRQAEDTVIGVSLPRQQRVVFSATEVVSPMPYTPVKKLIPSTEEEFYILVNAYTKSFWQKAYKSKTPGYVYGINKIIPDVNPQPAFYADSGLSVKQLFDKAYRYALPYERSDTAGTIKIKVYIDDRGVARYEAMAVNKNKRMESRCLRILEDVKKWSPATFGTKKEDVEGIITINFSYE